MSVILWLFYIAVGFVTIIPLLQIGMFKVVERYKSYLHVTLLLFLWWLVDFFRMVGSDSYHIYYLTVFIFPLVFLLVFSLFNATFRFLGRPLNKKVYFGGISLFFIYFVVSITNTLHSLVLNLEYSDSVTFDTVREASVGPLFLVFTAIVYVLLLITMISLLHHLSKRIKEIQDPIPFIFLLLAVTVGVVFNIVHVFFHTFYVDPTMVSVVVFISVLYYIFYMRDLRIILAFNRHNYLIDKFNENFVISNEEGVVVDASEDFIEMTGIDLTERNMITDVMREIEKKAVIYKNTADVTYDFHDDKSYLQMSQNEIKLPVYNKSGTFYLFYDETFNLKYIHDMNYVKTHDLMTKLYNRNYLEDIRDGLDDDKQLYHIVMFDLDGLKLFNDILGHEKGDDLLIRFAKQLLTVTTEYGAIPIRLGGDEFVILAINKSDDIVQEMIDRLNGINEELEFIKTINYSYAIQSNEGNKTMTEVLSRADANMYKMKKGKANYKEKLKEALTKELHKQNQ